MNDFSNYYVSFKTGFIINREESIEIPEYYDQWIALKHNLENLMDTDTLWEVVNEMPLLSTDYLISTEQLCYCHCILAMMTAAYVWYKKVIQRPEILPKCLSIPLREISKKLGLMPILCHSDLILSNTIVDQTKIPGDKNYLQVKEQITNNRNWNIFQVETAKIEMTFAPVIVALKDIIESISNDRSDIVIMSLKEINSTLDIMKEDMNGFNEMDPDYFHQRMRPFLTGWSDEICFNNKGLNFENEDGTITPIQCIGASAAQSPTLQVLDTLFQIKHSQEHQSFFDLMKFYMIKQHRDFIIDLQKFVNLPDFILKNINNKCLVEAYNDCLKSLSFLRTRHMQLVTKFIICPAKRMKKNEIHSQFLQEKGTGGQDLLTFLKDVRNDTNNQKIDFE